MADIMQDGSPMSPMEMQIAQQAIDRQRQLALALQQGSLQSPEGQMVSGHYVPPSWTQYISKLAQGLIGKNQQSDLDQKQLGIARQYNNNLMSVAQSLIGGGQQPQASASAMAPQSDPSNPSVANSPVALPTQSGDMQTFKAAPQYQSPQQAAPQAAASPASAPTDAHSAGGNPLFKGMSAPILGAFFQQPDSAFGKIATLQMQTNAKAMEPTDLIKTMTAAGIDPKSPQGQSILQGNIAKTNYIAPTNLRGQKYADQTGIHTLPADAPTGFMNIQDADGSWKVVPVQGGTQAIAAETAAKQGGINTQTLAPPAMSPTLPNGKVVPTTIAATINGGSGVPNQGFPASMPVPAPSDTGTIQRGQSDRLSIYRQELKNPNNTTADIAPINREIQHLQPSQPQGVGPAFGQEAGAVNAQTELTKKFSDLQQQNSQAQITTSYLQNIKQQAQKAAVGPLSDKIDYANGLLSLVGNERATNAVTANDLLNKYSNQIVSRLGTGGLGTDAARSIIQSAYPNSHMNLAAINEAANNLVGASEMIKAKTALLSPHGNARDPVSYQQKEQVFDQNADPRLWQYKAISDPKERAEFLQNVLKQDPQFIQKANALHQIGAF